MRKTTKSNSARILKVGGVRIEPGERQLINLNVATSYDFTQLHIPIEVIRGRVSGPKMFVSAAIHGDEINGTEIIRRLSRSALLKNIKGTLILVPVVNVFGYNNKSRYLPDRRDLNRCFPGSKNGSLASRVANIFYREIVKKCSHGIDLHTGAIHRTNLPQIRACIDHQPTRELAESFGVPVIINSKLRDGSLREASREAGLTTLLYEGGEALRFDEQVIRLGLKGCLSTMRSIGMLPPLKSQPKKQKKVFIANSTSWMRAPHSGSFTRAKKIGDWVNEGDIVAEISDPFGNRSYPVISQVTGVVIGVSQIPLVHQGEAMVHVASFKESQRIRKALEVLDEFEIHP